MSAYRMVYAQATTISTNGLNEEAEKSKRASIQPLDNWSEMKNEHITLEFGQPL